MYATSFDEQTPSTFILSLTESYEIEYNNGVQTIKDINIQNLDTKILDILKEIYPIENTTVSILNIRPTITQINQTSYLDIDNKSKITSTPQTTDFENIEVYCYLEGTSSQQKTLTTRLSYKPSNAFNTSALNNMILSVNVKILLTAISGPI